MIKTLSKNKHKIIAEIGYDINGKRKRKTETFYGTKKEAEKRQFEIEEEYKNKTTVINYKGLTWEEYSNKIFVPKYCNNNLSPKTIEGYISMLRKINSFIGKWLFLEVDTYVLNELYIKLKNGERVKTISNYTLLHYYNLINLMFEIAIDFGITDNNPNKKIKRPKKEKKLVECYDMEQVQKLFNCLDNECLKYQALLRLAIDSGARRSELLALTWEDIDFNSRVLTINKSFDIIGGKEYLKELKNNSSYRNMVLTSKTIEVLSLYKQELQENTDNFRLCNRLFLAKDGKTMYPTTCGKIFQKIAKKYDLPISNFHSLRHTCASVLISLGVHPKEIQDRMGHSSLNITMSVYSHIFQANRVEVANKLDTIF